MQFFFDSARLTGCDLSQAPAKLNGGRPTGCSLRETGWHDRSQGSRHLYWLFKIKIAFLRAPAFKSVIHLTTKLFQYLSCSFVPHHVRSASLRSCARTDEQPFVFENLLRYFKATVIEKPLGFYSERGVKNLVTNRQIPITSAYFFDALSNDFPCC